MFSMHTARQFLSGEKKKQDKKMIVNGNVCDMSVVSAKTINMFKNGIDKTMARIHNKFTYGIGSLLQTSVN